MCQELVPCRFKRWCSCGNQSSPGDFCIVQCSAGSLAERDRLPSGGLLVSGLGCRLAAWRMQGVIAVRRFAGCRAWLPAGGLQDAGGHCRSAARLLPFHGFRVCPVQRMSPHVRLALLRRTPGSVRARLLSPSHCSTATSSWPKHFCSMAEPASLTLPPSLAAGRSVPCGSVPCVSSSTVQ
jgi:hypothetical protein